MKILVTGGAGFIGSCFVRLALRSPAPVEITVLDKLTYAGNLENLAEVSGDARFHFVRGDICDPVVTGELVGGLRPDVIVHFAAESHVDRSLLSPAPVFETNLRGTFVLLEAARTHKIPRFVHVSTDEVYGSIEEPHHADEHYPLRPSSPYSASKAGSDLLALSYFTSYRTPVIVTRASNNYGPYQFPEKLIPLMISRALAGESLPVYGDGLQVRDWLFVEDHCRALAAVLERGREGEIYNIGGTCALPNLEVIRRILAATGRPDSLIAYVADRPGHDRRYAITSEKVERDTGWKSAMPFERGLHETIEWYRSHSGWVQRVVSGEYRHYYDRNYTDRERLLDRL